MAGSVAPVAETSVDWTERVALAGSALCMVHCLMLPLVVAAVPVLATALAIPETFHNWVLLLAVPAATFALVRGRTRHGKGWPVRLGTVGVACLVAGALFVPDETAETAVTVAGSLMLATAHIANWRLRHRCGCDAARVVTGPQ